MGKNPAFLFYPNDYLRDTQAATPCVRGIWMDLLCAMWWSQTRGVLTGTEEEMCRYGRCGLTQWRQFVELNARLNLSDLTVSTNIITVVNRRMVREERRRELGRCRAKRHYDAHSNANLTRASPSTPSTPSTPRKNKEHKTLVPVVAESDPTDLMLQGWPESIKEIPEKLRAMKAPLLFYVPAYWTRIDQWVEGTKLPVYYLDELKAYLANQASKNGRGRHRDLLAGYRNWIATALRWKERDAQRQAVQRRYDPARG